MSRACVPSGPPCDDPGCICRRVKPPDVERLARQLATADATIESLARDVDEARGAFRAARNRLAEVESERDGWKAGVEAANRIAQRFERDASKLREALVEAARVLDEAADALVIAAQLPKPSVTAAVEATRSAATVALASARGFSCT